MIRNRIVGVVLGAWLSSAGLVMAAPQQTLGPDRISDISNTKHNFASEGPTTLLTGQQRDMRAVNQNETCVFCHTPHFANKIMGAPLWNRQLSSATYTPYASSSMQAIPAPGQLGGSSKLCLSCHDGTLAIGAVGVANSREMGTSVDDVNPSEGKFVGSRDAVRGNNRQVLEDTSRANPSSTPLEMQGAGANGGMPAGRGIDSGYTSNLGTDLTNDHPISIVYDSVISAKDGELYMPGELRGDVDNRPIVGNRIRGNKTGSASDIARPALPLEAGKVECGTCHDPHIRGIVENEKVNIKFLRLNRFQKGLPSSNSFNIAGDINCIACHKKAGWEGSSHATSNHIYAPTAAKLREFPPQTTVASASCMNCHDSHAVQGARRLLREGTNGETVSVSGLGPAKTGGKAAQEETCYQCHTNNDASVMLRGPKNLVDIKRMFEGSTHMPINDGDQLTTGNEAHDVTNADLEELQANIGKGSLTNRHVECSDCHNPHRTAQTQIFNGNPASGQIGTHIHDGLTPHTNLASGSLKGAVGVEPDYSNQTEFGVAPTVFAVKKGNPSVGDPEDVGQPYVTREYQVCLRCHSKYGFDVPPTLRSTGGGTAPENANGMITYTDQAMEFQAPASHAGEKTGSNSGAAIGFSNNNHRSWHPVIAGTGRFSGPMGGADAQAYLEPFQHVGDQTMYCSDCHGSDSAPRTVKPYDEDGWGPHGSANAFILKGAWGSGLDSNNLCSKCHNSEQYSPLVVGTLVRSGFSCQGNCVTGPADPNLSKNLHALHSVKPDNAGRCMNCHVAVPHGFKNKGLLVNLNDVGPEGELPIGTAPADYPYTKAPYYNGAKLKVVNFKQSGNWAKADCASAGCHL